MDEISHCVNIEDVSQAKKRFSFDVPWADVKGELDAAYREIGAKARVKGFRPGRIPRNVLEAFYKAEAEGEAISSIVSRVYWEAVEKNDIIPVSEPVVDQKGIEKEKNFTFTVTVEVKPSIEPKDYIGIEVEKEEPVVRDEDVNERLEGLRRMYSTIEELKEDRGIREGDLATIDFEGTLDGVLRQDLKAQDYVLEIGSKRFVPGFEEQLVGVRRGETRELKVTFPEDYHRRDYAGKEVVFKVTVKEVKEKVLPALDENFVKNFEKYETLEDIKADIRKALEEEKEAASKSAVEKAIIGKLLESNPVEAPESIVEKQVQSMILDAQRRLTANGIDQKRAAELAVGMRSGFKDEAERMVKTSLILDSIARKENIEVTESDIDERLKRVSDHYGEDVESIRRLYEKNDLLDRLRGDLREEKTLDFVLSKAKINVKKAE
ncbi:MAG: trigger factor [Syntrophobacterales bacterium]|nr:trigger factor [Syntrophobacterales bacterium]